VGGPIGSLYFGRAAAQKALKLKKIQKISYCMEIISALKLS
jgi:hypothetical protein